MGMGKVVQLAFDKVVIGCGLSIIINSREPHGHRCLYASSLDANRTSPKWIIIVLEFQIVHQPPSMYCILYHNE